MKKKLSGIILCFAFLLSAFIGVEALNTVTPVSASAESVNLLQDASFSDLSSWTWSWTGNKQTFTFGYDTISHLNDGSGSLRITNTEINTSCVGQTIALEEGKEYILSCFIKIGTMTNSNAGGTGACLAIETLGLNIGYMSSTGKDTDWMYYNTSFVCPTTGNYRIDCRLWGSSGTVYFDDIRIESSAERENFLEDPTFGTSLQFWGSGWSNGGENTTVEWSAVSCFDDGTGSMHIVNKVAAATQQGQVVSVQLHADKKYIISGYIKVEWLQPNNAGGCGAYFSFGDDYGLGLGIQSATLSSPTPWKRYETDFTPAETGNYVLYCRIWGAAGEAYFDNVTVKEYKENDGADGEAAVLPEPDRTITPTAIRATKKTGVYVALNSSPVAAAPKGSLLVADAELSSGGNDYYRVVYADDGVFGQTGYVLKSFVEIDETATVYKAPAGTMLSRTAGATAYGAIEKETYVAAFDSTVNGYVEVFADVQSIVRSYISKSELTAQEPSTITQTFNLSTKIIGTGGVVGGISNGVKTYEKDAEVAFTITPNEGYICSLTCEGGILTEGQTNYSVIMTEEVSITIEFKAKLNRELYPITSFQNGENYKFDYTWISGITYYYGVADSATADGSGSLLVNNPSASHVTLNYMVELTAYTTYELKAKVKGTFTNPGTASGCGVYVMVENCINLGQSVTGTYEMGWTELSGEFTPTVTGRYSVNLRLWGCSGTVYFDEVSLIAVSQKTFTQTYSAGLGGRITETSVVGTYGDKVTVMAIPNPGYKFVEWSDGVKTPFRTDVILGDETVSAKFTSLSSYTVSYKAGEGGIVAGKTSTIVNEGSYRTMVAIPNEGYVFTGWSDGVKTAMRTDYITKSISVTANFAKATTVRSVSSVASAAPVASQSATTATAPVSLPEQTEVPTTQALLPEWRIAKRED